MNVGWGWQSHYRYNVVYLEWFTTFLCPRFMKPFILWYFLWNILYLLIKLFILNVGFKIRLAKKCYIVYHLILYFISVYISILWTQVIYHFWWDIIFALELNKMNFFFVFKKWYYKKVIYCSDTETVDIVWIQVFFLYKWYLHHLYQY